MITLNFDKTEENKFVTNMGSCIINDKRVVTKSIATSSLGYFNNKDISITESDEVNDNMINKTNIANITCKDTNQDAKIYLEILEL